MERDPVAHDRKTGYPDDSSPQTDSEFASRRRPFPVRIPAGLFYFSGTERLTLSFIGKCEGLRTATTILKRTMFQELPFAISTLNYRAEQSARVVPAQGRTGSSAEWDRGRTPAGTWGPTRRPTTPWDRERSLPQMALGRRDSHGPRGELDPPLAPSTEVNLKGSEISL